MGRYKRYLFGDDPVPKTTRNQHKKKPPAIAVKRKLNESHGSKDTISVNIGRAQVPEDHALPQENNLTLVPSEPATTRANFNLLLPEPGSVAADMPNSKQSCVSAVTNESIINMQDNFDESENVADVSNSSQSCVRAEINESIINMEDSFDESESDYVSDCEGDVTTSNNVQSCIELEAVQYEENMTEHGVLFEGDEKDYLSEPLCKCTDATAGDVLLQCLTLGLRHNLPWVAQVDILKMVNCLLRKEVVPDTKYKYLKHVEQGDITYHIFCPVCESYLGKKQDLPELTKCVICRNEVAKLKTSSFFLSANVETQLKEMLNNPEVVQSLLTYRFERKKINDSALEDIYDGEEYQRHLRNGGILSNRYNFSYCFSTDGVPMGKSSNKTVWPIYLTVNELPPRDRGKYVLLAGLYVGCKDPNQKAFLEPFVDQANVLSRAGINWYHQGKEVNSKLIPLCCIVDSVARWQVLNMSSFFAKNGCTFCYQKTERSTKGSRYSMSPTPAILRTSESTIKDSVEATLSSSVDSTKDYSQDKNQCQVGKKRKLGNTQVVRGVKGPSALILLSYFNLIGGFVPDYMHALLLGVIRLHTELIMESTRKKFWVDMDDSIGVEHLLTAINKRILNIKPPKSITRLPRTLKDVKLWKASEWRSWLVFYCIPCLHGLLKRKHLEHLALLSTATNILLKKSIANDEVHYAHSLFVKYACLFQHYFGLEEMVFNVHLLTHICQGVLSFGPVWTHNAFLYEGQNRYMLQLYQSPSHVALQIIKNFLTFNALPTLCKRLSSSDRTLKYCDKVLDSRKLRFYVRYNGIMLLGSGKKCILSDEENDVLLTNCDVDVDSNGLLRFEKMLFGKVRYTTFEYSNLHKNNDAFIFLKNEIVVRIEKILKSNVGVILIVREVLIDYSFKVACDGYQLAHIQRVLKFGNLNVTSVENIAAQCVFMNVSGVHYICKMPYGCYGD